MSYDTNWPNDSVRIDRIAQNGNDGEHYMTVKTYRERDFINSSGLSSIESAVEFDDFPDSKGGGRGVRYISAGLTIQHDSRVVEFWCYEDVDDLENNKDFQRFKAEVSHIHETTGRLLKALEGEEV